MTCGDIIAPHQFSKPYRSNDSLYRFWGRSEISHSCQQGLHIFEHGRMKFIQYGMGECSEVTGSTVPYLLKWENRPKLTIPCKLFDTHITISKVSILANLRPPIIIKQHGLRFEVWANITGSMDPLFEKVLNTLSRRTNYSTWNSNLNLYSTWNSNSNGFK